MSKKKLQLVNADISGALLDVLSEYVDWCSQIIDYNLPIPRVLSDLRPGQLYQVTGDVRKVRPREEPSINGLVNYLEVKL